MKGRILVAERDPVGRTVMDRVLASAGHAVDSAASIKEHEIDLDRGNYSLAIVDELAGTGAMLEEIRLARRMWPHLPIVATGTLLSKPVLIELLALGVKEALPKPFTPTDLRGAAERVLLRSLPGEETSLDWAAAMGSCRDAIGRGDLARADVLLRRALATAGIDGETMALSALLHELRGEDAIAERHYRAALALGDETESGPTANARDGLHRLSLYRRAAVVEHVTSRRVCWQAESYDDADAPREPYLIVLTVGLVSRPDAFVHFRESGSRGFAVSMGPQEPATLAQVRHVTGAVP